MPHSTTNIGLLKRISCIFIDIAANVVPPSTYAYVTLR